MQWQKLKELIQSLSKQKKGKKKGEDFEKLVARLLELLLEIPFVTAKSGSQPSGDARSMDGKVAIQAKNHNDKSNLRSVEIVGDINIVNDNLQDLQVYVLAASRNISAQLLGNLENIEKDTGLDIVSLELSDDLSNLGALCVTFWEDICHFFDQPYSEEFTTWIEEIRNDAKTEKKLEELTLKLEKGIQSQYHVKKNIEKYLSERFSTNKGFNPINLSQAIERASIESELSIWWNTQDPPVCYLEGEEGTGKTWLAAKWTNSILENENIVTFWLDSKDWTGSKSIYDLLKNCVRLIYPSSEERKISKLQSKSAKIWTKTIIVLDGVNERNAITTAQRILTEYDTHKNEWMNRVRFLFTTRPLDNDPDSESYLWDKCKKILVTPFNTTELQNALKHCKLQNSDLPDSLMEIASIPRYFKTCIELRNQFGSFSNVTKEMVLWVDLLDKIKCAEQVRNKIDWQNVEDGQEILAKLATEAKWTNVDSAPEASVELLKDCFTNYHEIRRDLKEQRIALKTGKFQAELNQDHIVLGWALYLSNLFDSKDFSEIRDFVECFQKALEPIPSDDLRTEALFVALQTTAISPEPDIPHVRLSQKRAALMLAWINSSNAQITKERISFWVVKDTDAYMQFIEAKFCDHISPNEEDALIEPLAKTWRNKKGQLDLLTSRLTKWLLPTYTDEFIIGDDNIDPKSLPFQTKYNTQIRLSTAALSILSQRPEREFLSTLARCYTIHETKPQFNENIGRLMRWGYTETVLGDLYWLAELAKHDEFLLKGFYTLSENLQVIELPQSLLRPLLDRPEIYIRTSIPLIENIIMSIRNHKKLLPSDSLEVNLKGSYDEFGSLAVRIDLPDLRDDDLVKIKAVLFYISDNSKLGKNVSASLEDFCIENLLPWIAKYDPEVYSELAYKLKLNSLKQKWAQFKLLSIQGLIFKQEDNEKIIEAILEIRQRLVQEEKFYQEIAWLAHLLTETLLFCDSEKVLIDWFKFLATHEELRNSICYETLPDLFGILLPDAIVELAQLNLEKLRTSACDTNISENSSEKFSEESYWCTLFSFGNNDKKKTVEYALEDLKMRQPDSPGTYPMLRLALSDPKLFLNETLTDERIQRHLYSKNGRRWKIPICEDSDLPSYEKLRSFFPIEIIGSFLCVSNRWEDLSRWGKDLMKWILSILDGDVRDSNSVEEKMFDINREVLQVWAEQNQTDFIYLSEKYLTDLCKSPSYQQVLSDFTDVIQCLLLRFQPETVVKSYQQWSAESVRTIHYNQYGIETYLGQLWVVKQCHSSEHIHLRRTLLEECQNDDEIMFMTIAAFTGKGEKELLNLVTEEYLKSQYAKERNLGVSILPWFGTYEVIQLLENLKSNDPSRWVRHHASWAYEVAQQERSCREVYQTALKTNDLFKISAVFEQIKPALTPSARWWHHQIEEEELRSELQDLDPKLLAIIYRFWYRWGKSSKTRRNIEIFGRKLSEYCRGEKLGSGSPPSLTPWWKPE